MKEKKKYKLNKMYQAQVAASTQARSHTHCPTVIKSHVSSVRTSKAIYITNLVYSYKITESHRDNLTWIFPRIFVEIQKATSDYY